MKIQGQAALVTGAGSGLGEATARELARLGAKVAVLDVNLDNARRVAADIGAQYGKGCAVAIQADVTSAEGMQAAIAQAAAAHGPARILMQIAGIGAARRVIGKDGSAAPLEDFVKVVHVNLIGTYNAARLFAAACARSTRWRTASAAPWCSPPAWPPSTARSASRPTAPARAAWSA
jgi:NAD(P)-dependent dehydrogenase (short-subunit alcohol dehydrogenase family)